MFAWFAENLGTILLTLVLIGVVAMILLNMRKEKQQGHSPCCGSCSHCAMKGCCHQKQQPL